MNGRIYGDRDTFLVTKVLNPVLTRNHSDIWCTGAVLQYSFILHHRETMVFTVAVVNVSQKAFVDPRLDASTPAIRNILSRTAPDEDSFQILTATIVPQIQEEISSTVKNLLERKSVDWIIVVGGIGFEESDCTPEVNDHPKHILNLPELMTVSSLFYD